MVTYPDNYNWLISHYGDVMQVHARLGEELKKAGPLDKKTIELVKLAAAAAIRSEGSVHSHCKRALAEGAKPEEIYHAIILLVSTIGFPTVAAALSWVREIVEP